MLPHLLWVLELVRQQQDVSLHVFAVEDRSENGRDPSQGTLRKLRTDVFPKHKAIRQVVASALRLRKAQFRVTALYWLQKYRVPGVWVLEPPLYICLRLPRVCSIRMEAYERPVKVRHALARGPCWRPLQTMKRGHALQDYLGGAKVAGHARELWPSLPCMTGSCSSTGQPLRRRQGRPASFGSSSSCCSSTAKAWLGGGP